MKIHINNDDNYATPPSFYLELDKRFNFNFDPCPYNEKEILIDGLKIDWGTSNFINPPYSQKLKEDFIIKGIEEMKKGNICVFLLPVSTSTRLFHDYIKPNATEIIFVKGRIKFGKIDEKGNFYLPLNAEGKTQSGTKDSMVVVFDGRLNLEKNMIDLNKCKPGDKLVTKHGIILEYVKKLNPEISYYDHEVKYPNGSYGSRTNSGHVMKNEDKRLELDEDVIKIL